MALTAAEIPKGPPFVTDTDGRLVVVDAGAESALATPANYTSGTSGSITGTSDTPVIAAPGAGLRLYITSIVVINQHATVGTTVNIKDGATTKLVARVEGASATAGERSAVIPLPTPLRLAANTALNAANVTTASDTVVSAVGYIAAV